MLEYETAPDSGGWRTLYSYSRKGDFGNNVQSAETVIYAIAFKGDEFDSSETVANYINGEWELVLPPVK